MRFLSATKAIKALNEITENEEDRNFETIIFADFNRIAVTNTMIIKQRHRKRSNKRTKENKINKKTQLYYNHRNAKQGKN